MNSLSLNSDRFWNSDRFCGLAEGDAYRAYLISRNRAPVVYHSGAIHLKRLLVVLRLLGNRIKSGLASAHLALVAARIRRLRFRSAWHLVHDQDGLRPRKFRGTSL